MPEDILFAKRICEQLREGKKDGDFLQLVRNLDGYFRQFAKRHAYMGVDYEDVVQDFWVELQTGNAICKYKGENQASLKTYLTKIIKWRIMSANKRQKEYIEDSRPTDNPETLETILRGGRDPDERDPEGRNEFDQTDQAHHRPEAPVPPPIEEKGIKTDNNEGLLTRELRAEIIDIALLKLEQVHPADARLVWMRMKGFSYKEIAQQSDATDPGEINKKIQALRKQFTRPKTGSMARFGIIVKRVMKERGIEDVKELIGD